jgi:hypothetical protein
MRTEYGGDRGMYDSYMTKGDRASSEFKEKAFQSLRDGVKMGSRLNLNENQKLEFEKLYKDASNYARKSYGGNT